ncbi:MAG: hypothetical protein A3J74_01715 [Elusimicrobia bacterium RIFCSPHIGHO2_02_FULL_57_9]|nr:MAG: hypothetical protein A3J74_01715 [Elusimicrobia bacterium RIFCSPHIGHO2_02_FULL_57_9]
MSRKKVIFCLFLVLGRNALAQEQEKEFKSQRKIPPGMEQPLSGGALSGPLRWMLKPLDRGMFIRLPIVDTDPNRGVTTGVMPIWVLKQKSGGDRIEKIYAPSLTYNSNFFITPTFRYYYYPAPDETLNIRGSFARYEREAMGEWEDQTFLERDIDFSMRIQYSIDASQRFFGIGPDTPQTDEANYKELFLQYKVFAGVPLAKDSLWRVHASNHVRGEKIGNGPLKGLRGFNDTYPGLAPQHYQQTNEMRAILDYDSRDHQVTTSEGSFFQVYSEHSVRGLASAYDYNRYGVDGRHFFKWPNKSQVTALQFKYEQLMGNAPFWLLPKLGGKYNLRAYGEGRYIDRGMMMVNAEQRIVFYKLDTAGVDTELEVAPFAGLGTVLHTPGRMARRYIRPVVGAAIRAIARPQVVGSVDFGVGQEGLAAFMDINYSF